MVTNRKAVFESVGAAQSFIEAMEESSERYDWLVHAYVLMRNHSHLMVETPKVNLVDGMQGLQSTIGTRFNRFRKERGDLVQDGIKRFCSKTFQSWREWQIMFISTACERES